MNTPDEVKKKIEEKYPVINWMDNHSANDNLRAQKAAEFGYSLAAPVPGKEVEVGKALDIWETNIPEPLGELLSNFAMDHTYPVRGIIRNLLSKIISECSPASPSTASNEDKFVWTDELVKNYAEGYRFSSSRLSIEKFKESKWLSQESVERNYKLAMEEIEPKAVQQAAKEEIEKCLQSILANSMDIHLVELKAKQALDFLAGASFNKDAVEFAEWIGDYENPFMKREDGRWIQAAGNSTSWTTEELYNLFKQQL